MTEDLAQRLRISRDKTHLTVTGIGNANTTVKTKLDTVIKSNINDYQFLESFWVLPSISAVHPDNNINTSSWGLPKNITLADPHFAKSQKVDLLLGAESFFDLLCVGQIKTSANHPTLQKTLLGWVVSGKYKVNTSTPLTAQSALTQAECLGKLEATVQKFWALEELPKEKEVNSFTPEQLQCETHFLQNFRFLSNGIFEVRLPFKKDSTLLGQSYDVAEKRFLRLEKRLQKDSQLKKLYIEFMNEYLELGHMSVTNGEIPQGKHYFIPHQCVLRPQSTTTKLRVVFDASCPTTTGISLNNILCVGPTVQQELYSILLRFRLNKYAITADITKMYRQFYVHEDDRIYQLIVWRKDPSDPLQICKLNTVTYGTSSAPFLATRCLKELGEMHMSSHPLA